MHLSIVFTSHIYWAYHCLTLHVRLRLGSLSVLCFDESSTICSSLLGFPLVVGARPLYKLSDVSMVY